MVKREVESWGRLERPAHEWIALTDRRSMAMTIARGPFPGLAFGNGRSYGDACLNGGGTLWGMRGVDRFIAFDAATGVVECEAGVLLGDVIEVALPLGWFLPVVPGTQLATVGGAVANDVHGKNHHVTGTFGAHVVSLELVRTDGSRISCGPDRNADWFGATVGGLGLTGVIESVRLQLRRVPGAWIDSEAESFETLERFFELSAEGARAWEYTVAWIDCGSPNGERGVFFRGNHASGSEAPPPSEPRALRFAPPVSLVNGFSVRVFNRLYRHRHRGSSRQRQHHRPFFFPLDNVLGWNRAYGPRGFYQYQCVVPRNVEREATRELLRTIAASKTGSFLAVLKTFGDRPSPGLLSFPMPGTTLALDFPNLGDETLELFDALDAIVAGAGGRLYPAKDARMPAHLFESGYPQWQALVPYRDPGISSEMSRRLFGS